MITATLVASAALVLAPQASAYVDMGCQTDRWGFLGSQGRTLCDGPRNADGSWLRARVVWTPAHQVPSTCYGGYYVSTCYAGYWVDQTVQSQETYVVTDGTVLPDEPGWLPPGTDVVR